MSCLGRSWIAINCVLLGVGLLRAHGALVDHFVFSPVPSPQGNGVPFQVTISAAGLDGSAVTTWSGTVTLSARQRQSRPRLILTEVSLWNQVVELTNPDDAAIEIANWRLDTFSSARWPEATGAFMFPAGTTVPPFGVLQVASANSPDAGAYPLFSSRRQFFSTVMNPRDPLGVVLRNDSGSVVDLVGIGGFDPTLLSPSVGGFWQGDPVLYNLNVTQTYQRRGNFDHDNQGDWVSAVPRLGKLNPGLRFPYLAGETLIPVDPPTLTIQGGVWTGQIKILSPSAELAVRADDADGASGQSNPFQVKAEHVLSLDIPADAFESAAQQTAGGRVSIPHPLASDLSVTLTSSIPAEVSVPSSVTIPSGQTNVSFAITNFDDAVLDGSQPVLIGASAPNFAGSSATIWNHDDEPGALSLSLPPTLRETDGVTMAFRSHSRQLLAAPMR